MSGVKIPAEFEMFDRTWKVLPLTKAVQDRWHDESGFSAKHYQLNGLCVFEEAIIYLKTGRPREAIVRTFFHEFGHAALRCMEWDFDEQQEEEFVELFAGFLQQFMKSQKGAFC